ncbi:MAG: hypothetical protein EA425_18050 [Puniceicoccaceae bacterium]|nr:MAG: hypothetical protein EA425_18050 [Puniceicoccaceae bacterium]
MQSGLLGSEQPGLVRPPASAAIEEIERNEWEIDAALRQSILKRALTGRLIRQDPATNRRPLSAFGFGMSHQILRLACTNP